MQAFPASCPQPRRCRSGRKRGSATRRAKNMATHCCILRTARHKGALVPRRRTNCAPCLSKSCLHRCACQPEAAAVARARCCVRAGARCAVLNLKFDLQPGKAPGAAGRTSAGETPKCCSSRASSDLLLPVRSLRDSSWRARTLSIRALARSTSSRLKATGWAWPRFLRSSDMRESRRYVH